MLQHSWQCFWSVLQGTQAAWHGQREGKVCEQPHCDKHPSFNAPGEAKGRFCVAHRAPGMENVLNKRCNHDFCIKRPLFNFKGELCGIFCRTHKKADMVNVSSKVCESVGCSKQPGYGFQGAARRFCAAHMHAGMACLTRNKVKRP